MDSRQNQQQLQCTDSLNRLDEVCDCKSDNFLTKTMQTASLQSKGQKQVEPGNGVEVLEQGEKCARNSTSWSPGGS